MSRAELIKRGLAGELRALEFKYLGNVDWEVRENANTNVSYSSLRNYIFSKLVKREDVLSQYLPREAVRMHVRGDIYIHKLPDSLWIPYCAGWSLERLFRTGMRTPTLVSRPAKHFSTAVCHTVNFFFIASQEWTGAHAVTAFDLYVAPFVRHDKLDPARVKQILQGMLFELNYPARAGYQSPFTNITLVMDSAREMLEGRAIVSGKNVGRLGDYVEEALMVDRALMELYLEGDALHQPFTFPIPTILLTRDFDWNGRRWGDLTDLIFTVLARKGSAYLLNGYVVDVNSLFSMCCRLTVDISRLNSFALDPGDPGTRRSGLHGTWALPDATGSIGVVTINLPRLALKSKGEWERFEELLYERLKVARSVLLTWRERYERNLRAGLMPMTRVYLGHYGNHYNTFGVVGLPEAAANFMREPTLWTEWNYRNVNEAVSVMRRMVAMIREAASEFEEEDGQLYNVEEIPGESAAVSLAAKDYMMYRELAERGELALPGDGTAFFYSNSIIPYYVDVPLYRRALWEGEVQREFTGGVMMHLFLNESPDPAALKSLVRRIAENTKVVYFSVTPTLSVCRSCGWSGVGVVSECPKCGSGSVEWWSRIVGYYRPVSSWNTGKKLEFRMRHAYSLGP